MISNKISPSQKPKNLGCQLQIGVGENFIVEKVPPATTLGAFKFLSSLKTFGNVSIVKVHLLNEVYHTIMPFDALIISLSWNFFLATYL